MMEHTMTLRKLTSQEEEVLLTILSKVRHPECEELKAQVPLALIPAKFTSMLHLDISSSAKRAEIQDGLLPGRTYVEDDATGASGEILVWIGGGKLALLEFAWTTEVELDKFPSPAMLHFDS
jgi:hypothetical protein